MKLLDAQIDLIKNIILQEINEIYDNFIKNNNQLLFFFREINNTIEINNHLINEDRIIEISINDKENFLHPNIINHSLNEKLKIHYNNELKEIILKKQQKIKDMRSILRAALMIDLNEFFLYHFNPENGGGKSIKSICLEFTQNITFTKYSNIIDKIDRDFEIHYSKKFLKYVTSYCKGAICEYKNNHILLLKSFNMKIKSFPERMVFLKLLLEDPSIIATLDEILSEPYIQNIKPFTQSIELYIKNFYKIIDNKMNILNFY